MNSGSQDERHISRTRSVSAILTLAAGLILLPMGRSFADAWDPADDISTSGTYLTPTTTTQIHGIHTLMGTDLYDWFRIDMVAGRTYHFETDDGTGDNYGELYSDAAGSNEVASNDDWGSGLNFSLHYIAENNQTYYLKMRKYSESSTYYSWSGNLYYRWYYSSAPPTPAAPTGPSTGYTCIGYQFSATATDPDDHHLRYAWDRNGDGIADYTSYWVTSGYQIEREFYWSSPGIYNIRVKAIDETGLESAWSPASTITIIANPVIQSDAASGGDAGNSIASAVRIGPQTFIGYMDECDGVDYYKFYAVSGQTIFFGLTPPTTADYDISLYDPGSNWRDSSTNGTGQIDTVSFVADVTGMWYVICWQYTGSGNYMATLSGVPVPARLGASLSSVPASVSIGQPFEERLQVINVGGLTADGVTPSLVINSNASLVSLTSGPVPAGPVTLAPGASQTFVWTYNPIGIGTVEFSATAAGYEQATSEILGVSCASSAAIQTPAALEARACALPSSVKQEETISVVLSVTNTGQATALSVAVSMAASPASRVALLGGPTPAVPQNIAGGASVNFTWTFKALTSGSVVFTGTGSGWDANSGLAVSASDTSEPATVVPTAIFAAAASASACCPKEGEPVYLYLTVTNTGEGAASGVGAGAYATPGGSAAVIAGPFPAAPIDIGPGSSTVFSWTVQAQTVGTIIMTASFSGTDVANGTPVGASRSCSIYASSILSAQAQPVPATATKGDTIEFRLTASNEGTIDVTLSPPSLSCPSAGTAELTGPSPAGPVVLAAGQSAEFIWTICGLCVGAHSINASVFGSADGVGVTAGAQANVTVTNAFSEPAVAFPNPIDGDSFKVGLEIEEDAAEVTIELYNSGFELVFKKSWYGVPKYSGEFDITGAGNWAPGIYLMRAKAKFPGKADRTFPVVKVVKKK